MGRARVRCVHGCECDPLIIDARLPPSRRVSVDAAADLAVTQSPTCEIEIVNLGEDGAPAKWKLTAVRVGWTSNRTSS